MKGVLTLAMLTLGMAGLSSFKQDYNIEVINTLEDMREWVEYDIQECSDTLMVHKLEAYRNNLDYCLDIMYNNQNKSHGTNP